MSLVTVEEKMLLVCPECSSAYGKYEPVYNCDECGEAFSNGQRIFCCNDAVLSDVGKHFCEVCAKKKVV